MQVSGGWVEVLRDSHVEMPDRLAHIELGSLLKPASAQLSIFQYWPSLEGTI